MIKKLKNNKACGTDQIRNEFLKNSSPKAIEIVTKIFNIVLRSGIVPHDWSVGLIVPIFKNKGSDTDPDVLQFYQCFRTLHSQQWTCFCLDIL